MSHQIHYITLSVIVSYQVTPLTHFARYLTHIAHLILQLKDVIQNNDYLFPPPPHRHALIVHFANATHHLA